MPPASDETTLYIISYDIPDDRRRTKIHRVLCGYGAWTQYSLFECWLTRRQLIELQAKLGRHIIAERDNLRYYPLCSACQRKVITVGSAQPQDQDAFIL
jgi:CRISPR-associated protein Cas2